MIKSFYGTKIISLSSWCKNRLWYLAPCRQIEFSCDSTHNWLWSTFMKNFLRLVKRGWDPFNYLFEYQLMFVCSYKHHHFNRKRIQISLNFCQITAILFNKCYFYTKLLCNTFLYANCNAKNNEILNTCITTIIRPIQ